MCVRVYVWVCGCWCVGVLCSVCVSVCQLYGNVCVCVYMSAGRKNVAASSRARPFDPGSVLVCCLLSARCALSCRDRFWRVCICKRSSPRATLTRIGPVPSDCEVLRHTGMCARACLCACMRVPVSGCVLCGVVLAFKVCTYSVSGAHECVPCSCAHTLSLWLGLHRGLSSRYWCAPACSVCVECVYHLNIATSEYTHIKI